MTGLYGYDSEVTASKYLELDDPGMCCLEGTTDSGYAFYLIILTDLGITSTVAFGPIQLDTEQLPSIYKCDYQRFEYSEKSINKTISAFLRQRVKVDRFHSEGIKDAHEIKLDEALEMIVDMPKYIINRNDSAY